MGGLEGRQLKAGDGVWRIKPFTSKDIHVCEYGGEGHNLFNAMLYNRGGRYCHEPLRVVLLAIELDILLRKKKGLKGPDGSETHIP